MNFFKKIEMRNNLLTELNYSKEEIKLVANNKRFISFYNSVLKNLIKSDKTKDEENLLKEYCENSFINFFVVSKKVKDKVFDEHIKTITDLSKKGKSKGYLEFVNDVANKQFLDEGIKNYKLFNYYNKNIDFSDPQFVRFSLNENKYRLKKDFLFNSNEIHQVLEDNSLENYLNFIPIVYGGGYGGGALYVSQDLGVDPEMFKDSAYIDISLFCKKFGKLFNVFKNGNMDKLYDFYKKGVLKNIYSNLPDEISNSNQFLSFFSKVVKQNKPYLLSDEFKQSKMQYIVYYNFFHDYYTSNAGSTDLTCSVVLSNLLKIKENSFDNHEALEKYEDALLNLFESANPELIGDIYSFHISNEKFVEVMQKESPPQSIFDFFEQKKFNDVALAKWIGIPLEIVGDIKIFVDEISKCENLSEDFVQKYGTMLKLFKQIENCDSKDVEDFLKNEVHVQVSFEEFQDCEKEGNNILRKSFVNNLKEVSENSIENIKQEVIKGKQKDIKVFKFKGEPFTMCVHVIDSCSVRSFDKAKDRSSLLSSYKAWNSSGGNNIIRASIINEKFMEIFKKNALKMNIVYGFKNIKSDDLFLTAYRDLGSSNSVTNAEKIKKLTMRSFRLPSVDITMQGTGTDVYDKNTIVGSPDELVDNSIENYNRTKFLNHNEIVFNRADYKPDFLVSFGPPNTNTLKIAEESGLPIYVVDYSKYPEAIGIPENYKNSNDEFSL